MRKLFGFLLLLAAAKLQAQTLPPEGQAPTAADFTKPSSALLADTSVHAVYLFRSGYANFVRNFRGSFDTEITIRQRVLVLDAQGAAYGNLVITLFNPKKWAGMYPEKMAITYLNCQTYQLDNGVVKGEALSRDQLNKVRRNWLIEELRAPMPNVRPGTVLDVNYTITVPGPVRYYQWAFAMEQPVLYSEFKLRAPASYKYTAFTRKNDALHMDSAWSSMERYQFRQAENLVQSGTANYREEVASSIFQFAAQNLPGVHEEDFASRVDDQVASVEIFPSFTTNGVEAVSVGDGWARNAAFLHRTSAFAAEAYEKNRPMQKEAERLLVGLTNRRDSALALARFVRDQFTAPETDRGIWLTQPLLTTWQKKKGDVADVNLTLFAFLKAAGLPAHPVLHSTRSNGLPFYQQPLLHQYDYVTVGLRLTDGSWLHLDASKPYLPLGTLPLECYGGRARVVGWDDQSLLMLPADAQPAHQHVQLTTTLNAAGQWQVSVDHQLGAAISRLVQGLKREDELNDWRKSYTHMLDWKAKDSLRVLDNPAVDGEVTLKATLVDPQPGLASEYYLPLTYLHPLQPYVTKQLTERNSAWEIDFPIDYQQTNEVALPEGYKVEDLPANDSLVFDGGVGQFTTKTVTDKNRLVMTTKFSLNRCYVAAADVAALQTFFKQVLAKEKSLVRLVKTNN